MFGPINIRPTAPPLPPPPPPRARESDRYTVRDQILWLQGALDEAHGEGVLQVLTNGREFFALTGVCSGEDYLGHACEPALTIARLATHLAAEGYRSWAVLGPRLDGFGPAAWRAVEEAQQ